MFVIACILKFPYTGAGMSVCKIQSLIMHVEVRQTQWISSLCLYLAHLIIVNSMDKNPQRTEDQTKIKDGQKSFEVYHYNNFQAGDQEIIYN